MAMMDVGSGDCEEVQMSRSNPNHPNYLPLSQTDAEDETGVVDGRLTSVISAHELGKLLECPVCYEVPLPPVFMCASGHNICLDCRNQCLTCPVCRCSFSEARNHLAECIVEKCSFLCRYHNLGCSSILTGNQMVKHLQQECEFRPVTCRDCKRKIPFESYLEHLTSFENIPKQLATECSTGFDIEEDDFSHDWTGQTWEPTWLHCFSTDFFCYLESSSLYWWIYVIGYAPDTVLEGFMYDVLVWNQSKSLESRFIGPVHSYRKTGSDILHTGKCLKTTEQGIRSMMNQGGIDVVVRIFRTSDYQPPKSRNTGQPIYSPLSLRINNNNNNSSVINNTNNINNNNNNNTPNSLAILSTNESESPSTTNILGSHSHTHSHQQRNLHTLPVSSAHLDDNSNQSRSNAIALALALEEVTMSSNVGNSGTEERNNQLSTSQPSTPGLSTSNSINIPSPFTTVEITTSSNSPISSNNNNQNNNNTNNNSPGLSTSWIPPTNSSNESPTVLQPNQPQGRRRVRTPRGSRRHHRLYSPTN